MYTNVFTGSQFIFRSPWPRLKLKVVWTKKILHCLMKDKKKKKEETNCCLESVTKLLVAHQQHASWYYVTNLKTHLCCKTGTGKSLTAKKLLGHCFCPNHFKSSVK